MHLRNRRRILVIVIEGEAHAENDAALKALARVLAQRQRVIVAAGMEEKRGYPIHFSLIKTRLLWCRSFTDVNNGHNDGGAPRPLHPLPRLVDRSTVFADPAQAGAARIALRDRVRGDETERSAAPRQIERAPEELGDQIGVAVRLF